MGKIAASLLIAFAFWFAAETYVGVVPNQQQFAKPLLYVSIIGLVCARCWSALPDWRIAWHSPAFALLAVIAGQLIWRDFIHARHDFKLYAAYLGQATVFLAILTTIVSVLEWRIILRTSWTPDQVRGDE